MTQTALEKAKRKFDQAKAALDAVKARETQKERKKDTRRKIVLGGALLKLAKADKEASALVSRLIAGLARDHDKKLFEKSARKEAASEPEKRTAPASQQAAPPTLAREAEKVHAAPAIPGYDVPPHVRPDTETI